MRSLFLCVFIEVLSDFKYSSIRIKLIDVNAVKGERITLNV